MTVCPVCAHEARCASLMLHRCPECDHLFQWPPEINVDYDADYVGAYDAFDTLDAMSYLRLGLVKAFRAEGRLLDVGYGNGAFLKAAVRGGFDAYGNDVHGQAERYGIREASLNGDHRWDVVTFFDSLEHFPDLALIKDLLQRAGLVVVSLPERPAGFPERTLSWKHYKPGEHLHYFCESSLSCLMGPGKELRLATHIEDAVRQGASKKPNILTTVWA